MTAGTNDILPPGLPATDSRLVDDKSTQVGDWAIHSWGSSRFPGMAAISAIATLQLSATLAETAADKLAMDKAAEYLTKALASQIKSFQQASDAAKHPKLG